MYVDSEKSGVFLSTEYSESFDMIENFSAICQIGPHQDTVLAILCAKGKSNPYEYNT